MTKIRNTKKGMAKKTLSISLAVAMLATSNVPVWAAEDLFTDGEVAVEAFSADEVVEEEAPVVEDTEEVVEAQAGVNTTYKVNYKLNLEADKTWKDGIGFDKDSKITVSEDNKEAEDFATSTNVKGVYVAFNVDGEVIDTTFTTNGWSNVTNDRNISNWKLTPDEAVKYAGKSLTAYVKVVLKDNTEQILKSSTVTINPINLGKYTLKFDKNEYNYNGNDKTNNFVNNLKISIFDGSTDVTSEFDGELTYTYGNDMVNAGIVEIAGESKTDKYIGAVKGYITIKKATTAESAGLVADLKDGVTVEYQESTVKLNPTDVIVTDNSKQEYNDVVKEATVNMRAAGLAKPEVAATVNLESVKGSLLENNYEISAVSGNFTTEKKATVVARNLDNCTVTVKDSAKIKPSGASQINLNLGELEIRDAAGKLINLAASTVKVTTETNNGAVGTYTVTVSSLNDKLVTGTATGTFEIANSDLNNLDFYSKNTNGVLVKSNLTQEYKGSSIGDEELSSLVAVMANTNNSNKTIIDRDVNYEVAYGENVNAGKGAGTIIVTGKTGTYAGSKKVVRFDINPAPVQEKLSTVPETVAYVGEKVSAKEYKEAIAAELKVVACKNDSGKDAQQFVLEYGKDYDLVINDTKVDVNDEISVIVKVTNKNFFSAIAKIAGNDSENYTLTKKVRVANKAITSSDIQINGEYTYTGDVIDLDYAVVVDGKELVKDKDYTVVSFKGIDAGEGSITIKGIDKNGYDSKVTATAKFEIKPADAKDVVVTLSDSFKAVYNGEAHKPEDKDIKSIKLGTVDVMNQFTVDTTKYGTNTNAGEGSFVLKTKGKGLTNFVNTKDVTFEIERKELKTSDVTVTFKDKLGFKVNVADIKLKADGTAKTFADADVTAKVVVRDGNKTLVEGEDYLVGYYNNVDATTTTSKAYFYVQAINNYAAINVLPESAEKDKEDLKNVIYTEKFDIKGSSFTKDNVTVENGEYAGGFAVKPVVTVVVDGKTLVEGIDYELVLSRVATEVTVGKTESLLIRGLGMYKGMTDVKTFVWGVDKKNLENCFVTVTKNKENLDVVVMNGNVTENKEAFDVVDNGDGTATVSVVDGGKNYTGSTIVTIVDPDDKGAVGVVKVADVKVDGNKVSVILDGEAANAEGYDYVIATEDDYKNGRVDITKNQLKTTGDFYYVQKGTYYAYCHAYRRDENGQKIFSPEFSNRFEFKVGAITPDTPQIKEVVRKGSTVTVTYEASENASGYDVVLGTALRKVHGEKRPVDYGTLVKKNQTKTTVVFKNVPAGTYYVGMHAYNRTNPDNNTKVFSPWENYGSKVIVK